jgi:hypothetical protein
VDSEGVASGVSDGGATWDSDGGVVSLTADPSGLTERPVAMAVTAAATTNSTRMKIVAFNLDLFMTYLPGKKLLTTAQMLDIMRTAQAKTVETASVVISLTNYSIIIKKLPPAALIDFS